MKTLSSCYFCGAALDEPLEEYPVVPSEFREGEPSTRATLCPGCHRKLETIFEEALPAASEGTLMDSGSASVSSEGDESPAEAESEKRSEERSGDADFEESKRGLADADDVLTDPEQPTSPGEDVEEESPDGPDRGATQGEMDETSGSGHETEDGTGEKPETETDDEGEEPGVVADVGDAKEGHSVEEGDQDEVTPEDIEAMAGDLDPGIVEDDDSEPEEDDELGDAMEPDVPAAFQTDEDADTDPEGEGSALSEGESADEVDGVEQVSGGEEPREDDQGSGREEARGDEQGDTGEETVEDAMEPDVPTEFQSGGGDESAAESESTEAESADEAAEGEPAEPSEDEPTDDAEEESATTGEADAESGTDAEVEVSRSVSALEYNKVMRLLQNREFPVDRDEIETVAASAYELAESECAEVIDLAVDRGLLDEEDGKLIRP